jgi:hypothetical protein
VREGTVQSKQSRSPVEEREEKRREERGECLPAKSAGNCLKVKVVTAPTELADTPQANSRYLQAALTDGCCPTTNRNFLPPPTQTKR